MQSPCPTRPLLCRHPSLPLPTPPRPRCCPSTPPRCGAASCATCTCRCCAPATSSRARPASSWWEARVGRGSLGTGDHVLFADLVPRCAMTQPSAASKRPAAALRPIPFDTPNPPSSAFLSHPQPPLPGRAADIQPPGAVQARRRHRHGGRQRKRALPSGLGSRADQVGPRAAGQEGCRPRKHRNAAYSGRPRPLLFRGRGDGGQVEGDRAAARPPLRSRPVATRRPRRLPRPIPLAGPLWTPTAAWAATQSWRCGARRTCCPVTRA